MPLILPALLAGLLVTERESYAKGGAGCPAPPLRQTALLETGPMRYPAYR
jgi:hypothetical protein